MSFGVAAALSRLTGVFFGLAPAIRSTRVDVAPALKETRASQPGARYSFWRISLNQVLVVGQIAISLLLLVVAGLFVRTLSNLQSVKLGFNGENVLLFQLDGGRPAIATPRSPTSTAIYGSSSLASPECAMRVSPILAGNGLPISVPDAAILICAAILAGYVHPRKASRIDPITALRHE